MEVEAFKSPGQMVIIERCPHCSYANRILSHLQRADMPIQGEEPYEEDLDWLKYGRVMIQESPKVLDEAAKSFLTLGSSLLTVYTGALALFKFNERASDPLSWAVICTPILLWLLCISCLAYVYFPDRLRFHKNSPTDIEKVTSGCQPKEEPTAQDRLGPLRGSSSRHIDIHRLAGGLGSSCSDGQSSDSSGRDP